MILEFGFEPFFEVGDADVEVAGGECGCGEEKKQDGDGETCTTHGDPLGLDTRSVGQGRAA